MKCFSWSPKRLKRWRKPGQLSYAAATHRSSLTTIRRLLRPTSHDCRVFRTSVLNPLHRRTKKGGPKAAQVVRPLSGSARPLWFRDVFSLILPDLSAPIKLRHPPRSVDRNRSLARVSEKREYFKCRPETIGDFAPKLFNLGVWRRTANSQKPQLAGTYRIRGSTISS